MQALTRGCIFSLLLVSHFVFSNAQAAPTKQALNNFVTKLQTLSTVERAKIHKPNQLLIRYRSNVVDVQTQSIASSNGAISTKSLGAAGPKTKNANRWRLAKFASNQNIDLARTALLRNPNVESVEYDYLVQAVALPTDPELSKLWGLNNTGVPSGLAGTDIDAFRAWEITVGDPNVIVGVIDTGVDYNHPDLRDNMWINNAEIPANGIDDDNNGYIDDIYGANFMSTAINNGDPLDDQYHGTHVAGTIGATGNNGIGVVGVNWQVKLMALKFLGSNGRGSSSDAIKAINYAVAKGAKILNNSWGGGGFSQALADTISAANDRGVLFLAAAGNGDEFYIGYDVDDPNNIPHYPSGYTMPNVVSVASIDRNGLLANSSNWGLISVDLAAPGVGILSTFPNNTYATISGTSMATPQVAGVAALILAQEPTISVSALKNRLLSSVDLLPALNGKVLTGGYVNAYKALAAGQNPTLVADPGGPYTTTVGVNHTFDGSASISPLGVPLNYSWDFGDGSFASGARPNHTYSIANTYTVSLTVDNGVDFSQTATTTIIVNPVSPPPNSLPIANPGGPYTTIVLRYLGFDGTASSDPAGGTLSYDWDFGDGVSGVGPTPAHAYQAAGDYTVSLIVNNGTSASLAVTTQVTVNLNPFTLPIADPGGPYSGIEASPLTLNGTASNDPLGGTLTYNWDFGDGSSGAGSTPTHNYQTAGIYTVSLIVNNGTKSSVAVATQVTITKNVVSIPIANPGGPYSDYVGRFMAFDGTGSSDPAGGTLTYSWDFGDGSGGGGPTPAHAYQTAGIYTASLLIFNGTKYSAVASTQVTINPNPLSLPIADPGGPYSNIVGRFHTFDGTGSSDPAGGTLTYTWDFGDGSGGSGAQAYHPYATAGTYIVTLLVHNGTSYSAPVSTSIVINPNPLSTQPTADPGGPYSDIVGRYHVFDGSGSSDPQGKTLTYTWDFGDGSTGSGMQPYHPYTTAGDYIVSLTVDNGTQSSTVTTTITITPNPI